MRQVKTVSKIKEVVVLSKKPAFMAEIEACCREGMRLKFFRAISDVFLNENSHDIRIAVIDADPELELSLEGLPMHAEQAGPLTDLIKRLNEYSYRILYISSNPTAEKETRIRRLGVHFFLSSSVGIAIIRKAIVKLLEHETSRVV